MEVSKFVDVQQEALHETSNLSVTEGSLAQ